MVPGQLGIYSSQRKREASASKISLLTPKVMTLVAYGMFLYRRVTNRIRTCLYVSSISMHYFDIIRNSIIRAKNFHAQKRA